MKLSINLASRRHFNQRALQGTLSGIIVLLLLLLTLQGNSYLQSRQQAQRHQAHLAVLQEQLSGKLPEQLTPEQLAERRQAYAQAKTLLQRDAFRWTALFGRMEKLLPDGVSLRSFSPDYTKNSLLIHGVARDLTNLQALLDNLQAARFKQVYLKNQGEVEVDNGRGGKRTALSFSINLKGVL